VQVVANGVRMEDMVATEAQAVDNGVKMEVMVATEALMVVGEARHGEEQVEAPGQLEDVVEAVKCVEVVVAAEVVVVGDGVERLAPTKVEPTAVIIY